MKPFSTNVLLVRQSGDRRYFRGISGYARENPGWSVLLAPHDLEATEIKSVPQWADAVVIDIWAPRLRRLADAFHAPVVNLIESLKPMPYPTVCVDNREVGRVAFEHLRSLGLSHFAYLQWEKSPDDRLRREGFERAAEEAGLGDRVVQVPSLLSRADWSRDVTRQAEVFAGLPRPIGIFCFADWLASLALQALQLAELSVPEEVAVVGVDDDEVICESAQTTLTSVDTHLDRVGYEAAKLAAAMANGEAPPPGPIRIPPLGVIERMSTQVMATDDADVAKALQAITRHVNEGVSVTAEQIAQQVIVSRRGLDNKFTRVVGHTVAEEISRQRMRRVLKLLAATDLKMVEIAARTGFRTISHLSRAVSRHTGRSPGAYRQWARV